MDSSRGEEGANGHARMFGAGRIALWRDTGSVRQSGIDKIRYPELIMKLAHQQGGTIKRRDVEQLLRLQTKQAYRELVFVERGPGSHYEVSR